MSQCTETAAHLTERQFAGRGQATGTDRVSMQLFHAA